MTYQCQTWVLNKNLERKITTCEMKCLRKTLNVTRRDRIRNEKIRERTGTKPVLNFVEQQRIKWFGHVLRMSTSQPAARSFYHRESGYKSRGRPRKDWLTGIKETLADYKITTAEANHLAYDRMLRLPSTSQDNRRGRKK